MALLGEHLPPCLERRRLGVHQQTIEIEEHSLEAHHQILQSPRHHRHQSDPQHFCGDRHRACCSRSSGAAPRGWRWFRPWYGATRLEGRKGPTCRTARCRTPPRHPPQNSLRRSQASPSNTELCALLVAGAVGARRRAGPTRRSTGTVVGAGPIPAHSHGNPGCPGPPRSSSPLQLKTLTGLARWNGCRYRRCGRSRRSRGPGCGRPYALDDGSGPNDPATDRGLLGRGGPASTRRWPPPPRRRLRRFSVGPAPQ